MIMYRYFKRSEFTSVPARSSSLSGIVRCLVLILALMNVAQAGLIRQGRPNQSRQNRGETITIDVGPYVQFTGPTTAVVRWDTPEARDSIVEYWATDSPGLRVKDSSTITTHEITLSDLQFRMQYSYRVGYTSGSKELYTDIYTFNNAINYTRLDCSDIVCPYPADSLSSLYETAAEHIINQTGIEKGFCLVYGCGEGRLAFELAKCSDLIIIGVDTDPAKIQTAINQLMEAGVYGTRIKLQKVESLDHLRFTKYFFNLIVSDRVLTEGACPGSADEMVRVLRPGGSAFLGQPTDCPHELTQTDMETWLRPSDVNFTTTQNNNGLWFEVSRIPLDGAEPWPRQYGHPDNAANSGDTLEGATQTDHMMIQWIGSPGADFGADRNPRMPSPVTMNGRLYHQGLDRILAMDAYNGTIYWSLEIPGLLRVNTPRDNGYVCADTDGLYIAVDDDCWFLDGDTGTRTQTFKLSDDGLEWGYVAISKDMLYGTAQFDGAHYTNIWGGSDSGWFDKPSGSVTYKVCSQYIFANDKISGNRLWTDNRSERGITINSTITMDDNRIYFVESRHPTVKNDTSGRIGRPELWRDQYIVALNKYTGEKLWDKAIDTVNGIVVFYMQYSDEKLFITSSETRYYLYAYDATDGRLLWSKDHPWIRDNHSGHMQHPVIAGNVIYLEPNGYDINTGEILSANMGRHGGCATYAGTSGALVYRGSGGNIAMWEIDSGTVSTWSGIRPSCWLSTIPGGGMILSPEGSGGCSCNGWLNTSVGFVSDMTTLTPR
ncbi:MAG: methyltransferase domain-containing protein [Sedimentisphaerales bacterium]|nr:methyltransferase domain-containing protein [Sedimentisphaerales bacterium]